MNFKTTYFLFGILFAVLGVFLVTQRFGQRKAETQTYVLPSLHDITSPVGADDVDRVEIARYRPKKETLVFYKNSHGDWLCKQPDVRVENYLVTGLIDQVIGAHKDEEADVTSDLAKFGLNNPSATITIVKKGGSPEWKLNIGDIGVGGDKAAVYVTSSDLPNQPMAVTRSTIENAFKQLNDYRSKDLLADTGFDITWIKLQKGEKGNPVTFAKSDKGKWSYEQPPYGEADFDGETHALGTTSPKLTGLNDLLQAVNNIKVESDADFVAADADDKDLADKGLVAGKESIRIDVKRQRTFGEAEDKTPVTDTLLIGKKADDKGENLYARLLSNRSIVKVPAKKTEPVEAILDNPSLVRNRDLVLADSAKVDAIDIKLNDQQTVKLRKVGSPAAWKMVDGGKLADADMVTVNDLLGALTAKRQIKSFPDANHTDAELGLDRPATVVSLWVEGIKKEEPKEEKKEEKKDDPAKDEKKPDKTKDDKKDNKEPVKKPEKESPEPGPTLKDLKPTIKLVFGKRDRDEVYVLRDADGQSTRLALPATLLDKVSEGKLAYLDRKLPSFAMINEVSKIGLVRGGESFELTKDDKSVWKFQGPKNLAGRLADALKVNNLLSDLREMVADKLITEKPSEKELDRVGLKVPVAQVTLTINKADKKTETLVYAFGKETETKTDVYALQNQRDLVFTVKKLVLEQVSGDLLDPTVFTFDPAKVQGLQLVGWHDLTGSPFKIELERKSAQNWVVNSPAGFKLDMEKAETLVKTLSSLRADKFVGSRGAVKPEYHLELKDGALEVSVKVEGSTEPFRLTVGGANGTEGYFATSNKLVGDVFVLNKTFWDPIKAKPAYFKKE